MNKPHQVLCQFSDDGDRKTLATYIPIKDVYPAGRLDYDSEGLVALTDDGKLQARISHRDSKLAKHYWAQVEGDIEMGDLSLLAGPVELKDGPARAILARGIPAPSMLWPRDPPIRVRKSVPDSWIEIVIDEGRNRQVRRMTAAAGWPTLRLIRHRIGPWSLDNLKPGEFREIELEQAWRDLKDCS
jgi:23S rRNA pseudouridine2457 synthase